MISVTLVEKSDHISLRVVYANAFKRMLICSIFTLTSMGAFAIFANNEAIKVAKVYVCSKFSIAVTST